MSSQYGELRLTSSWDQLASLGHPSKFQPVSSLASLLQWRRSVVCTMFDRLLGCYTIYTFSGALAPTEFCQVQNSLCVWVLHSPILAALLHGTPAAVSAKLCGVVQGMELQKLCRGCHLYSAGRPSRWESAHILVKYHMESRFFHRPDAGCHYVIRGTGRKIKNS